MSEGRWAPLRGAVGLAMEGLCSELRESKGVICGASSQAYPIQEGKPSSQDLGYGYHECISLLTTFSNPAASAADLPGELALDGDTPALWLPCGSPSSGTINLGGVYSPAPSSLELACRGVPVPLFSHSPP